MMDPIVRRASCVVRRASSGTADDDEREVFKLIVLAEAGDGRDRGRDIFAGGVVEGEEIGNERLVGPQLSCGRIYVGGIVSMAAAEQRPYRTHNDLRRQYFNAFARYVEEAFHIMRGCLAHAPHAACALDQSACADGAVP